MLERTTTIKGGLSLSIARSYCEGETSRPDPHHPKVIVPGTRQRASYDKDPPVRLERRSVGPVVRLGLHRNDELAGAVEGHVDGAVRVEPLNAEVAGLVRGVLGAAAEQDLAVLLYEGERRGASDFADLCRDAAVDSKAGV